MSAIHITELMGDGIGPELAESIHAVAESLPAEFKFIPVDWSLPNREKRGDDVIDEAEDSMRQTKLAVKYPTITNTVSYTHLRAHETDSYLVCRLLLEKKNK